MRCASWRASRRRRGRFPVLLFLLVGPAGATRAADAGSAPGPSAKVINVTWPDIVRLVERHPRFAAGRLQIDAARGFAAAAGAVPNPTVEGSVGQGRSWAGDATRFEWGLTLSVPLGWLAQRGSRIAEAEAEVEVAAAESQQLRREILLELLTLYWSLGHEQARVVSLDSLAAQTAGLVAAVRRRVEKGEARPVEATRVEIELDRVGNELDAARLALSAGQAALALWLGAPEGQTIVVAGDLAALPAVLDRDTAMARTEATHPAVRLTRARTRALGAALDTEKRARVPSASLGGFAAHELDRRAYGVGLAVTLPVWNWNRGGIARAEAQLSASRQQAGATARQLATTVIEAQSACQASATVAGRLGHSMVPRSESAAATMERTYQLGEASLLEVIDARRTLLETRRLYLKALAQAQIDCGRLGLLVGEEIP